MENKKMYLKFESYTKTRNEMLSEYLRSIRFRLEDLFDAVTSMPNKQGVRQFETTNPDGAFWEIGWSPDPMRFSDLESREEFDEECKPTKE